MFLPILYFRTQRIATARIFFTVLIVSIGLVSCQFKFSSVTNTHNGITMTLQATSKTYKGNIQCDSASIYSDICANPSNYKVAVYVVTDILYIHPQRNSYTRIAQDGSWSIEKVNRKPLPKAVYAFVLRSTSPIPEQPVSMDEIEYLAWVKWAN